jgi:hypothetical protein|tara:strand:- start:10592 stop:11077 length:486 start_codon:yes stop_codon:yes gene_type:complete
MSSNQLIKKIIKQELTKKTIKEQISEDPNTFITEIDDVSFSGLKEYFPEYSDRDMDVVYLNCKVLWRYDLDVRSWGIKDISIYTTSVVINAMVEIYDEDYNNVESEKEIEVLIDNMGGFSSDETDKWYYEDDQSDEMRYHTILPTSLDVDLSGKFVNVYWN